MKNIGTWLYRYVTINMAHRLHYVLALLDGLVPAPVYRPELQRVRTPISPDVNDIRLRSDFLTPMI